MQTNMTAVIEKVQKYIDSRTFLLCAIVFLVISWWIRRQPRNLPPGPWTWPILGSLPNLAITAYRAGLPPLRFLTKLGETYGEVYSFYLGNQLLVFANSSKSIREAFQNRYLTDRPIMKVQGVEEQGEAAKGK